MVDLMQGFPPDIAGQVTLANWREPPFNRWAFHHVREIVPTARIANDPERADRLEAASARPDLGQLAVDDGQGQRGPLAAFIEDSFTDGLVILHRGRLVFEWFHPSCAAREPHIVFSLSKSLTAALVGILVDRGEIDPQMPVTHYLPEVAGSAYGDCTVRHVLDMVVALDFEESYLDTTGAFNRYRQATGWNPVTPGDQPPDLRSFLTTLPRGSGRHGDDFLYASPNSDLLGWIVERATGTRYADLFSELIWQPLGAAGDGYVTVDRLGAPRSAGGICVTLHDLARFAEMMRQQGAANGRQIVPEAWVADIRAGGSGDAWQRGSMAEIFPAGNYRSQWYQTGRASGAFAGIGIHGQWIYVDPAAELTMVRAASQPLPVDDPRDLRWVAAFETLAREFGRA